MLKRIRDLTETLEFNNYHEPFLGGGAVFFNLELKSTAFLSDLNSDLIETYKLLKENPFGILKELQSYQNSEDFYYELRKKKFKSPRKRAARFIYLNQTSFNGIYRVNLDGVYNVPYGFRKKNFLDSDGLLSASEKLQNTELFSGDFVGSLQNINEGDLVFLDPPYTISHNHNGFFKYNRKLFSKEDQYRLSKMVNALRDRGVYYILTNACHKEIKSIFQNGDNLIEVERQSVVGGKKAKRGIYKEIILTNID